MKAWIATNEVDLALYSWLKSCPKSSFIPYDAIKICNVLKSEGLDLGLYHKRKRISLHIIQPSILMPCRCVIYSQQINGDTISSSSM